MLLGIMQGRLLPPINNRIQCFPKDRWNEEFSLASSLGIQMIEWIYEDYGSNENPLSSDTGISSIEKLAAEQGVQVLSLCADYFMDYPFLRCSRSEQQERISKLKWLLDRGRKAHIRSIVLPFVDAANIRNVEEMKEVVALLQEVLPLAEQYNIELHLEADLPPNVFHALLCQLRHPLLMVNYDSGNSASLGYSISEEFKAYGERIGSIHIKDRLLGGSTVSLGKGAVNFIELATALKKIQYERPLILQIARGVSGDEVHWIKKHLQMLTDIF